MSEYPQPSNTPANPPVTFPQQDGIFVLNKPAGPGSAQCLKVFKKMGQKKVGHAGTLDPMASGVLPVLLGQATKLSNWLLCGGGKTYEGILRLGIETDTWDTQGQIIRQRPWQHVDAASIAQAIASWQDLEKQDVPAYSAAKHHGTPLYKLARDGHDIPQKTKKIKIFEAGISHIDMPFVSFRVSCSSGSYIRSLAHSLGMRLQCGAALCGLVRTHSHPFSLDDATKLADLQNNPDLLLRNTLPLDRALPGWPVIHLISGQTSFIKNGRPIPINTNTYGEGQHALLFADNAPLALAQSSMINNQPHWIVVRGLWN